MPKHGYYYIGKPLTHIERSIVETWNLSAKEQATQLNLKLTTVYASRSTIIKKLGFNPKDIRHHLLHPEIKKCNLQFDPNFTEENINQSIQPAFILTCQCGHQVRILLQSITSDGD